MSDTTKKKAAEKAEEAVEAQNDEVTTAVSKTPENVVVTAEKQDTFVYLGPNLPKGLLKNGAIFNGTRSEVLKHLESITAAYPEVGKLIVVSEKLPEAMTRLQTGGNLLSNDYAKLQDRIKNK